LPIAALSSAKNKSVSIQKIRRLKTAALIRNFPWLGFYPQKESRRRKGFAAFVHPEVFKSEKTPIAPSFLRTKAVLPNYDRTQKSN
jgi:hypothetical protein